MRKLAVLGTLLSAMFFCVTPVSIQLLGTASVSIDKAEARIGRPLTPMSVAGVNRRVHRRAYYGAAAGAAAAGAYYYGRRCGYYPYPPCY
jgi:hypothetical protein